MWELDCKESWVLKNWCFWTVVLEKTLESPLDWNEIQPVHPKGDQSWIFIGRTNVEAETPILWPPDAKNWLIGKDPDAGKDWRWEEKGMTEDEMVGWHHRLDGHGFEWTLGVGYGQRGLVFCRSYDHNIKGERFTFYELSHSVVSNSLWPHGLQHACHSPTPRSCSNSCPWSWWCHSTISSSVDPFCFCLQSFLASGYFPMRQLFESGDQTIGASATGSVLPMNIQDWSLLGLSGLISLQSKELSRVFSNTPVQKRQFFGTQVFYGDYKKFSFL